MNHIERTRDLSRKIPELKKLQDEKHRLDQYTAFRAKLENVTTGMEGLADLAGELRKKGREGADIKRSVHGILLETRQVIASFNEDKSIILTENASNTFWRPLESMLKKINVALKNEWKAYVESKIPSSQADILETLSKVQGFAAQAAKVRALFSAMRSLEDELPQAGDFERLDTLAEQVKQAWDELHSDEMPPAVLGFLKNAHTPNGVSLLHLDQVVLDWLKNQNLLGQYTIRGK